MGARKQSVRGAAVAAAVLMVASACSAPGVAPSDPTAARSRPSAAVIPLPTALPEDLSYDEAMALFEYDRSKLFDVREVSVERRGAVTFRTISYAQAVSGRVNAMLIVPDGAGPFGGILYLHGAGGSDIDFVDEAVDVAGAGVVGMTITQPEAPEASDDPNPPYTRIAFEIRELRRALDLLAAQPGVDSHRLGFAGFSFGAVRGATLAGVEGQRLRAVALASFNPSYGTPAMRCFDPITWLPHVAPASLLMQLGRQDAWYTVADGEAMLAAAHEPKNLLWYDADHGLNAQAYADRVGWLREQLGTG